MFDRTDECVTCCVVQPSDKCEHGLRSSLVVLGFFALLCCLLMPGEASAQLYGGWGGRSPDNAYYYPARSNYDRYYRYRRYQTGYVGRNGEIYGNGFYGRARGANYRYYLGR
ncbi:hypothetical protein [Bythopirellula goksoeyrii]|uniref:Uncharacterized protein n=1 Tax=Bythopirellula goksoeyrii TaxID=1400387 RepID=A0A5B9QHR3_9BACT|nr:hypothetical protein [Bythopirellula goksoeyrii]QEG33761.1 hypothetical protein Pr1d_10310 [Bythopirellula goksoeyrii]